ncbi:MAG: hypothetical protein H7Z73_08910 [Candidatus Saccharibacteria bacterium]|nr:hypothetical protein [Moraxellaceae bacterium]
MKIDLAILKGSAIWDLAKEGHILLCPVCGNQLITIPEQLTPGGKASWCYLSDFTTTLYFYAEPADRVQNVRRGMALIATEMSKKDT